LYQEQYKNLAECIWAGANGVVINPEPVAKYGAEIMLHSSFADKNWQPLRFPEEIRDYVKLRNIYKDDRGYFVIPQSCGLPEIGAVVGLGNTLEEAFDHALENAELVEGYYLEGKTGAIEQVREQIDKMDQLGLSVFNED
jgi:predicted RNase H-like HicB family nuclease